MTTYDAELFALLFEIFPDAFSVEKTVDSCEYRPGPFGMEEVPAGKVVDNLAADILSTAGAIALRGRERAIAYIKSFQPAAVQRREIKSFTRR